MRTLSAFTEDELGRLRRLLSLKVATMMGRKLEEGDWSEVYCAAKDIPQASWSNLHIDVMHGELGVEQKALRPQRPAGVEDDISLACEQTYMHPSLTRSFTVPSAESDATEAARDVLGQYADLIELRRKMVAARGGVSLSEVDLRLGWLLWQSSLRQFLYFEVAMDPPDPTAYTGTWKSRGQGGQRKGSTNLWIYDRETGEKRYSVTTSQGGKIQPYFEVPPREDENLYILQAQGEHVDGHSVRVWLTGPTARRLGRLATERRVDSIDELVAQSLSQIEHAQEVRSDDLERVIPITVERDTYEAIRSELPNASDEQAFRMIVEVLDD